MVYWLYNTLCLENKHVGLVSWNCTNVNIIFIIISWLVVDFNIGFITLNVLCFSLIVFPAKPFSWIIRTNTRHFCTYLNIYLLASYEIVTQFNNVDIPLQKPFFTNNQNKHEVLLYTYWNIFLLVISKIVTKFNHVDFLSVVCSRLPFGKCL